MCVYIYNYMCIYTHVFNVLIGWYYMYIYIYIYTRLVYTCIYIYSLMFLYKHLYLSLYIVYIMHILSMYTKLYKCVCVYCSYSQIQSVVICWWAVHVICVVQTSTKHMQMLLCRAPGLRTARLESIELLKVEKPKATSVII